mmetsp:Transcript_30454/g.46651  ORF Transcript_30454/g.46651 Transcript_30454/m.46651 type:complete len:220 (+) Transcript_30454:409-1068(+)
MQIRYLNIAARFKEVFENDPGCMKDLRRLFTKQNDKLSYYDLFHFIKKNMKIDLENWEEDALEHRLDRLSMAFIEFNEFNEFCLDYQIDFGERLLQTDLEDVLDARINLSYKDYKVTEEDYFRGCPTMLNNEKAALAKVRNIYKEMKKNKQNSYIDPDFGPQGKNDDKGHKFSIYKTGEPPMKGYPETKDIDWVFSDKLCRPGIEAQFVKDGASSNDCV